MVAAEFIERHNRFVAEVLLFGERTMVHVKNTGRCRELLLPGAVVYLSRSDNPSRKMQYDLIAVEKHTEDGVLLINMDSSAPNSAVREWLAGGLFSRDAKIFPERTYGDSRFDFYIEDGDRRIFLEVKGVTLEDRGVLRFPDAPTERGVKHIRELMKCTRDGYEAYVLFVIQMPRAEYFEPNGRTDPEFADALRDAVGAGVRALAVNCRTKTDEMKIDGYVDVRL